MMICFLKIIPVADQRKAIFEILQSVKGLIRGRPGCVSCDSYEEHNSQRAIFYVEQWETKKDLERHIQSSLYQRILAAMELASEVPEICFHEVAKTTGMDLIEALRTEGERIR